MLLKDCMAANQNKILFYYLLKQDKAGLLEKICTVLCDTPNELHQQQQPQSFLALREAVLCLARKHGQLKSDRDVLQYADEGSVLFESGNAEQGLSYLGRALETCAIVYAVDHLASEYQLGSQQGVFRSLSMKKLMQHSGEKVLGDVQQRMQQYRRLYQRQVDEQRAKVSLLLALRRQAPKVYKILGQNMKSEMLEFKAPPREEIERDLRVMRRSYELIRLRDGLVTACSLPGKKEDDLPFRIVRVSH
jgi:hypothetical protein